MDLYRYWQRRRSVSFVYSFVHWRLKVSRVLRIGKQLFEECRNRNERKVIKVLRKEGKFRVAVKYRDGSGYSILHEASRCNLPSVILSSERGSGLIREKSYSGNTPLQKACKCGHPLVVEALIMTAEGRAAITERDQHGENPLHEAATALSWCRHDILRMLLATEEGQKAAGMKDDKGQTPRHLAKVKRFNSMLAIFDELCKTQQGRIKCIKMFT